MSINLINDIFREPALPHLPMALRTNIVPYLNILGKIGEMAAGGGRVYKPAFSEQQLESNRLVG